MRETVATLKQKINEEIEKGNFDAAAALTEELCELQGLDQTDSKMPASFPFEIKKKGKAEKMMNMKKHIAKAAAVVVILGVSGGTVYAATQHFQQAQHMDNGLAVVNNDAEVVESNWDDESMFEEAPVLSEEDTDSDIEVLSTEEGTEDTAWLRKVVSRVTHERYASDDGVNWEQDDPDVKEVTEYTYQDYDTACADTVMNNLLKKSFEQYGTVSYRDTHFLDEELPDTSSLTAGFKYGGGKFTLEQSYDPEAADVNMLITSTEGVTNQREYVSKNGDTFALSDDTETGETRTTTMVTYGNYTVILTFTGMSEQEIHEVLDAVSTEI